MPPPPGTLANSYNSKGLWLFYLYLVTFLLVRDELFFPCFTFVNKLRSAATVSVSLDLSFTGPAEPPAPYPHFTERNFCSVGISGLGERRGVGQFTENFLNPLA